MTQPKKDCDAQTDNDAIDEEQAEKLIGWFDATLDAAMWFSLHNLTPRDAALLMCNLNPNEDALDPLNVSNEITDPGNFKNLLQVFNDEANNDKRPRRLIEWHQIAANKKLRYHSWIDNYLVAKNQLVQNSNAPSTDTRRFGVTKREILSVDWPLPEAAPPLENILDEVPIWVTPAREKFDYEAKGGRNSYLWNPAILGVCLATKTSHKQWVASNGSLRSFISKYFPGYLVEWDIAMQLNK